MKIRVGQLRSLIKEAAENMSSGGLHYSILDSAQDEFTAGQYDLFARKIVNMYRAHPEANWEKAIKQCVDSWKTTTGVALDPEKLRDAIDREIEFRNTIFGVEEIEE